MITDTSFSTGRYKINIIGKVSKRNNVFITGSSVYQPSETRINCSLYNDNLAYFLEPSDTDNAGEMPENTMVQQPGKIITSFETTYLVKQRTKTHLL